MKHPSTRDLYNYWNERRGARLAPERGEIEPSEIRQVLGDTFVLACDGIGNHPFRLAGTRLCSLFGRELKGESFVKLWERTDQAAMRELIGVVIDDRGNALAVESRPATLHSDHPNWAEEDPEEWWRNVGDICRALLTRPGIAAADIAGVGVTGALGAFDCVVAGATTTFADVVAVRPRSLVTLSLTV